MCARADALAAAFNLSGARAGRARQLAELVVDAQCHCERLDFLIEADGSC
jgi:hypothetical protein